MPSFTFASIADVFPAGTTVGAYPASGWPPTSLPPSGAPVPAATTTAAVGSTGTLEFTGLAAGTRYVAGAQVSGTWRYRQFSTPAAVVSDAEPIADPTDEASLIAAVIAIRDALGIPAS